MPKKFILATKNKNKAREFSQILGDEYEIITRDEAGLSDVEVVEDGLTFEENAIKKARAVYAASGIPVIADDSGLCVTALGDAPGVYSARYAGKHGDDEANLNKVLAELEGKTDRSAKFVCAIAFVEEYSAKTFVGRCYGEITKEKKGENGFGYDPVFYIKEYKKTMAELSPEIKNKISHRAKACLALKEELDKTE